MRPIGIIATDVKDTDLRFIKLALLLPPIVFSLFICNAAMAHGPAVRFGVVIGEPVYRPYYPYYPPSAYYYPPVAVMPPSQQTYTYTERADEAPPQQTDWFYCPDKKAYYPYVSECVSGWQRVKPTPPGY